MFEAIRKHQYSWTTRILLLLLVGLMTIFFGSVGAYLARVKPIATIDCHSFLFLQLPGCQQILSDDIDREANNIRNAIANRYGKDAPAVLNGMNVRAANVSGEDGIAVEVFTVEVARGTWPDTAKLRDDLAAVLSDSMAIGERLTERERVYPLRRGSAAHLPGSDVSVDNEASETATVLEVRAPDQIGLLHRITRALFEADLDVVSARVSTLGEIVVDAFYVRESDGTKVTDQDRLSAITAALRGELGLGAPIIP